MTVEKVLLPVALPWGSAPTLAPYIVSMALEVFCWLEAEPRVQGVEVVPGLSSLREAQMERAGKLPPGVTRVALPMAPAMPKVRSLRVSQLPP